MEKSALILSKLAERFPGLVDGDQEVNGGDVVSFLSQYQDELAAIAEKGAQTGRRRALPKQEYVVQGDATYSDKHVVTDAHVAAAKFLKKRKVLPKVVVHGDQAEIVAGRCALSGTVIFESDDYLYLRRDVQVDAEIDGQPVGVVPDLQKVLRSEQVKLSFPDDADVKWYERAEVEGAGGQKGSIPIGQEPLSGTLSFPGGESVTFDRATPREVNEVTAHQKFVPNLDWILPRFEFSTAQAIHDDLKSAKNNYERAKAYWSNASWQELESFTGLAHGLDGKENTDWESLEPHLQSIFVANATVRGLI